MRTMMVTGSQEALTALIVGLHHEAHYRQGTTSDGTPWVSCLEEFLPVDDRLTISVAQ